MVCALLVIGVLRGLRVLSVAVAVGVAVAVCRMLCAVAALSRLCWYVRRGVRVGRCGAAAGKRAGGRGTLRAVLWLRCRAADCGGCLCALLRVLCVCVCCGFGVCVFAVGLIRVRWCYVGRGV